MGFFRQEYRSGLPFPSPRDLTDPGIKPISAALQVDSTLLSHGGNSFIETYMSLINFGCELLFLGVFSPGIL